MENLSFLYRKPSGEEKEVVITHWRESGNYILGVCLVAHQHRTYRKDRIVCYRESAEHVLVEPFPEPPPLVSKKPDPRFVTEILFTGFPSVQRASLEAHAAAAGLTVVKTVTKNLDYLCCGPTAGPAKLEKARDKGVWILNQPAFFSLLETGELPDEDLDFI